VGIGGHKGERRRRVSEGARATLEGTVQILAVAGWDRPDIIRAVNEALDAGYDVTLESGARCARPAQDGLDALLDAFRLDPSVVTLGALTAALGSHYRDANGL
jgi:hypothetical protein